MAKPRILVSNDDGIDAPGITALIASLEDFAEVWVVAPDRERSAASHAISLHNPLRITELGERRFSVDGTPTDCVYIGLHRLLDGPPDLVISGINSGPNLGNDVLYSGTVAAAMEGALFGYRAIAMSLCLPDISVKHPDIDLDFAPAAEFAARLTQGVLPDPVRPGVVLNVNVPYGNELRGVKLCRLGYTDWANSVHHRVDPRGKPYYWIGGERTGVDDIPDSDNNAVASGYIAVTPVHYDLTDYRSFDYVRGIDLDGFEKTADGLGDGPLPHPIHPRFATK